MRQLLIALAFALFLVQATGALTAFLPDVCAESCPDDDADGHCPPSCVCCTCCGHLVRAVAAREVAARVLVAKRLAFSDDVPVPRSIHARGILHIPKSLLA